MFPFNKKQPEEFTILPSPSTIASSTTLARVAGIIPTSPLITTHMSDMLIGSNSAYTMEPSPYLRTLIYHDDDGVMKFKLQQKWFDKISGRTEWRDVPSVVEGSSEDVK